MAKLTNPVLFSTYFKIAQDVFDKAGLIDHFVDTDTQLFIDPVLLEKSSYDSVREGGLAAFKNHFEKFVRLLAISENEYDPAWLAAQRLLDLTEPPENGLGYGSSS